MPQVRVNVRSLANVKAVRKEKRNGRDVVIVPSATLPDDIIMNRIKYPSEEIEELSDAQSVMRRPSVIRWSTASSSPPGTRKASTSAISGHGTRMCAAKAAGCCWTR